MRYGQIKVLYERFKGCYPRVLRKARVGKGLINRRAELIPPLVKRMRDPDLRVVLNVEAERCPGLVLGLRYWLDELERT